MFNENSGLVKVWVRLIQTGAYALTDVPNLSNLRDTIETIINKNNKNAQEKKAEAFDYLVEGDNNNE